MDINTHRQPEIRVVPMPSDTNAHGDIFGGWMMSQVDIAGSLAAYRYVGNTIVTVAVNEFIFKKPVQLGDVISIYAEVDHIGNTSIRVAVSVYADHEYGSGQAEEVANAVITYVSIDKNKKPLPIRKQM